MGSKRFTFHDLFVILANLPRTSATARAKEPEDYRWGLTEELLASALDYQLMKDWYRGGKKGEKPTPIPRPSTRPKVVEEQIGKTQGMTFEEADAWLETRRAAGTL